MVPNRVTVAALGLALTLASAAGAPAAPSALEQHALALINDARTRGVACPGGGGGRRLPALRFDPTLRSAALAHATDMGRRRYLSHFAPGGTGPRDRVRRAGYSFSNMSEIIYKHSVVGGTATSPVRWWLRSAVHCRAIMNPVYTQAGVGYSSAGKSWTAILARPR